MKLNRNIFQISATAIITAAIVYFIMKAPHTGSEPITWVDAIKLIREYESSNVMKTKYMNGDRDTVSVLNGFVFSAVQLDSIINENQSSIRPDKVLFLFGKDGSFLDTDGTAWPNMHFVAVGVKKNQILTGALPNEKPSIYDKADPCPPNCPVIK